MRASHTTLQSEMHRWRHATCGAADEGSTPYWGGLTGTEKARIVNVFYEKTSRDHQARTPCNAQENSV